MTQEKSFIREYYALVKEFGFKEGIRIFFHRQQIKSEINKFKERFRNKDIRTSPEACMLFEVFGHTNIDKLTLQELYMLGFNSCNIWREDYDIF